MIPRWSETYLAEGGAVSCVENIEPVDALRELAPEADVEALGARYPEWEEGVALVIGCQRDGWTILVEPWGSDLGPSHAVALSRGTTFAGAWTNPNTGKGLILVRDGTLELAIDPIIPSCAGALFGSLPAVVNSPAARELQESAGDFETSMNMFSTQLSFNLRPEDLSPRQGSPFVLLPLTTSEVLEISMFRTPAVESSQ